MYAIFSDHTHAFFTCRNPQGAAMEEAHRRGVNVLRMVKEL